MCQRIMKSCSSSEEFGNCCSFMEEYWISFIHGWSLWEATQTSVEKFATMAILTALNVLTSFLFLKKHMMLWVYRGREHKGGFGKQQMWNLIIFSFTGNKNKSLCHNRLLFCSFHQWIFIESKQLSVFLETLQNFIETSHFWWYHMLELKHEQIKIHRFGRIFVTA